MTDIKELRRLAEAAIDKPRRVIKLGGVENYIKSQEVARFAVACEPSAILSLLDKIDAQEKEIAELHTSIAGAAQHGEQCWQRYEAANKMCLNQQNEIAWMNESIAELRKDAERYRWLRNESWAGYNSGKKKPEVFETVTMVLGSARNFNTILAEEALDEAVDAALLADTSTQEVG